MLFIYMFINDSYSDVFGSAVRPRKYMWNIAEAAVGVYSRNMQCICSFSDGKPALLGQTRTDSGKGWKHAEATSYVSVQ